jgi:hypothetical protein
LYFLEKSNHEIRVLPGNARKRLPACQVHHVPNLIHERSSLSLEIKTAGASISRIVTSLQPPVGLHGVKDSHESRRLKIRQLRELHLAVSFVIGQIYKHSALWERQAESTCSLLEALPEYAARVF